MSTEQPKGIRELRYGNRQTVKDLTTFVVYREGGNDALVITWKPDWVPDLFALPKDLKLSEIYGGELLPNGDQLEEAELWFEILGTDELDNTVKTDKKLDETIEWLENIR